MNYLAPSLYGIKQSNRLGENLWGKNQFNSTFPASLACYMRDKKINPVYLRVNKKLDVVSEEISFDDVFRSKKTNENLYFDFESKYTPYQNYSYDDIGVIDLVIRDREQYLRPLEVKLTVVPDNSTYNDNENKWGAELVIRPVSTLYSALGIAHRIINKVIQQKKLREILEPVCSKIQHWDNNQEMIFQRKSLLLSLDDFQKEFIDFQEPFLMQPIWKTNGKSPILNENAFDIFIWSDFALCRTFLDKSQNNLQNISRLMRSSARLARILYSLSMSTKINIKNIYTEMSFGHQTDKEFAINGIAIRKYIQSERLTRPILSNKIVKEIILNGGEKKLSPERRFDATIFFTIAKLLE